jgi:hypothetical protein
MGRLKAFEEQSPTQQFYITKKLEKSFRNREPDAIAK